MREIVQKVVFLLLAAGSTISLRALVKSTGGVQNATNAQPDIKGIKEPLDLRSWLDYALPTLLGLLLAVAAFYLWRWWKKRKANEAFATVIIPPHRRAREQLRRASDLMGDPNAFCTLVSGTIRTYLEERFALRAPERTTEEFLLELTGSSALDPAQKQLLADFLSQCDLVKFARYEPMQSELEALLQSAYRLIEQTEPNPPPVTAARVEAVSS